MKHIVFLIAYAYFLISDMKSKKINEVGLTIYAVVALTVVFINRESMTYARFIDMLFSLAFGLTIFMLCFFSGEQMGLADGIFFVINGFLLTLKENLILFFTGLLVAFIIGIILYLFLSDKRKRNVRMPFMPCFLPAIIGYILCTV